MLSDLRERRSTASLPSSVFIEQNILSNLFTRCNSGQFYPVLSEDFCAQHILSLTFMHIHMDDQETFWLVIAFYFTSCYNPGMHCRNLE